MKTWNCLLKLTEYIVYDLMIVIMIRMMRTTKMVKHWGRSTWSASYPPPHRSCALAHLWSPSACIYTKCHQRLKFITSWSYLSHRQHINPDFLEMFVSNFQRLATLATIWYCCWWSWWPEQHKVLQRSSAAASWARALWAERGCCTQIRRAIGSLREQKRGWPHI